MDGDTVHGPAPESKGSDKKCNICCILLQGPRWSLVELDSFRLSLAGLG
jgi:hypothetical protein